MSAAAGGAVGGGGGGGRVEVGVQIRQESACTSQRVSCCRRAREVGRGSLRCRRAREVGMMVAVSELQACKGGSNDGCGCGWGLSQFG